MIFKNVANDNISYLLLSTNDYIADARKMADNRMKQDGNKPKVEIQNLKHGFCRMRETKKRTHLLFVSGCVFYNYFFKGA